MQFLFGHSAAALAHLSLAYPFGGTRCVRREWIERAEKGASKGQYRFVTQTTVRAFNYDYTARIERDGQEAADAWAQERIAGAITRDDSSLWNAAKPGIYHPFVAMRLAPLDDDSGRLGVWPAHISLYSTPADIDEMKAMLTAPEAADTLSQLAAVEQMSRRINPRHWHEYDAQKATAAETAA
jgi:hypothetical protein